MIWKTIPSFSDYEVSETGLVRRIGADKYMKTRLIDGYHVLTLMKPASARANLPLTKRYTPVRVNRLVCEAFHGVPSSPGLHAAHINGQRDDNRSINLRWSTPYENQLDRERHGTVLRGEQCGQSVLTAKQVVDARNLRAVGASWRALARTFATPISTIRTAVIGRSWRCVPLIMLLLVGCSSVPSSTTVTVCPSIVEYSRERQARAGAELRAMPPTAELPGMFADYGRLRDQVRACRAGVAAGRA